MTTNMKVFEEYGTPEYEAMGGDKFYFQFGYYRIW